MFLVNSRLRSFAAALAAQRVATNNKQFPTDNLRCWLVVVSRLSPSFGRPGQGIYRRYARFFAEFLNENSLVHLRILSSPTCVGLRYECLDVDNDVAGFSRLIFLYPWPRPEGFSLGHLSNRWQQTTNNFQLTTCVVS